MSQRGDDRFVVTPRSPLCCLAMAMLFVKRQWLKNNDFRLYFSSHRNELFPPHSAPDIIIYIDPDLDKESEDDLDQISSSNTGNASLFDDRDRRLMDDFYFELIIKQIASKKYGKLLFFDEDTMM